MQSERNYAVNIISLIQDGGTQFNTFFSQCYHERICNNYIEIKWKNIQVIFIILWCTRGYNLQGETTRRLKENHILKYKLIWKHQLIFYFFQHIGLNLTPKWPNGMNITMNVSGTVCQLIHYFSGKLGSLAINLTWPAL